MLKPNLPLMPHPFKALMKAADSGPNKSAERAGQSVADTSANDMKEEVGLMFSERAESQKKACRSWITIRRAAICCCA